MTAPFASFKSGDLEGLLDVEKLRDWLDRHGVEPGADLEVRRISGGMSNESIGVVRERQALRAAAARGDRARARRSRHASASSACFARSRAPPVPHPPPVALCDDRA